MSKLTAAIRKAIFDSSTAPFDRIHTRRCKDGTLVVKVYNIRGQASELASVEKVLRVLFEQNGAIEQEYDRFSMASYWRRSIVARFPAVVV